MVIFNMEHGLTSLVTKETVINKMTALELLEKIDTKWVSVNIIKGKDKINFLICLNHKKTIKTNEGVNGIKLYSRKRFLQNVGNFQFEFA